MRYMACLQSKLNSKVVSQPFGALLPINPTEHKQKFSALLRGEPNANGQQIRSNA